MKWQTLLELIGNEPVFSSALLRTGNVSDSQLRVQLTRWTKSGRLIQLKRGLYILAAPYRKFEPHPFLIANMLKKGSYISFQSALGFHGLIPEFVPVVTSVTTLKPWKKITTIGTFTFNHVKKSLLFGYTQIEVDWNQKAFVAQPEKALLDLIYLTPGGADELFIRELRLQNLEILDKDILLNFAEQFGKKKLITAVKVLFTIIDEDIYEEL